MIPNSLWFLIPNNGCFDNRSVQGFHSDETQLIFGFFKNNQVSGDMITNNVKTPAYVK